jgi:hypothetical protein
VAASRTDQRKQETIRARHGIQSPFQYINSKWVTLIQVKNAGQLNIAGFFSAARSVAAGKISGAAGEKQCADHKLFAGGKK